MRYLVVFALVSVVICCNENVRLNNDKANESTSSPQATSVDTKQKSANDVTGCYRKITGRDTALLLLEQKANDVSGQLLYDSFEKDGSSGTVKGKKDGDILKLFYDFNSEGTHSVMEVYFKQVTGGLLRGVGDMVIRADTAYFRSGINYSDKEAFSKVDCSLVKLKFQ